MFRVGLGFGVSRARILGHMRLLAKWEDIAALF